MALTILELLANDTAYISKHNTNYTAIKAAIDALQSAIGGVSGGEGSAAVLYEALMAGANGAIGASSYTPTDSATAHILNIAAGYAYDEATDTITTLATATTLNFTGQTTGTYYIHADQLGSPYYDQILEGALFSVYYNQSTGNFTSIARTGGLYYSAADLANLQSNLWSIDYATADARVDGAEKAAIYVLQKTVVASPIVLTDAEAFEQNFISLEDGPQTASIVLTVPALQRVYMVSNDCSSTYTVTLTPDSGTGYAIPGKSFAVVFVNGSTAEPLFLLDLTTGASPVNTFLQLDDVDDSTYTGKAGYLAKVNAGEDGLELFEPTYGTGTGDVSGPASSVASNLPKFSGITGKILADSGWTLNDSGSDTNTLWSASKISGALGGKEPALGNPGTSGFVLSSTTGGVRSWVEMTAGSGGGGFSDVSAQTDQATVTAATSTLYVITTGATNPTCTVNLPVPSGEGEMLGVIFFAQNATSDTVVIHPATGDEINDSTSNITLTQVGEYVQLVAQGDSTNWLKASHVGAEPQVYVQSTEPTAAAVGAVWVEIP